MKRQDGETGPQALGALVLWAVSTALTIGGSVIIMVWIWRFLHALRVWVEAQP